MGHEFSNFTAVAIQAEICPIAACTSTSRSSPGISIPSVCIASGGHERYGGLGTVFSSATSRYPEGSRLQSGGQFSSPQQFPGDSSSIVPGVTPLQTPPQNLPVIRSWTKSQQNIELPRPQGCFGHSESVPVYFVPDRPYSELLHPPRHQQGAISRVRFSSALLVFCQMWFDLLSQLDPLSRIWQETSMSQHQRMHLNRILDNVAPDTAMKYLSSCKSFCRTCKVLQVDVPSLTKVHLADILITRSLSRSTSHSSSSCSSVMFTSDAFPFFLERS